MSGLTLRAALATSRWAARWASSWPATGCCSSSASVSAPGQRQRAHQRGVAPAWVTARAGGSPGWLSLRLTVVRGFARWLQALDPATEVPPTG